MMITLIIQLIYWTNTLWYHKERDISKMKQNQI